MNRVPAGLQHLTVVGAVALAHAAGLWALLDHALQPATQSVAAPVMRVSLLSEPAAARPPPLLRAPPPVLPEPPRVAPPPLLLSPPAPPPPPAPAVATVPAPAAEPVPSERPLPSSETSSAAITAAALSSVAESRAPVPVARAAAAPGVPRQIEQVDYLRAPVLEYPSASRRYGEQGRVVLRVLIGRDGHAEKVELHEPSAFPRLNDAAIEAARRALFKPHTEDGVAQPAWALVALSFQLRR